MCSRDDGNAGQGGRDGFTLTFRILTDQLSLPQPRGADYAPHISTRPFRFSDLPYLYEDNIICEIISLLVVVTLALR